MKSFLENILLTFKKLYNDYFMFFTAILSLFINITIECMGRKSIIDGMLYVIHHPFLFLYNALIIYMTISLCLIFKRRSFILSLMSFLWIFSGTVNFVLLSNRTTPFSAMDIKLLSSVINIITVYLKPWQIALIFFGMTLVLLLFIFMWIKAPVIKGKVKYIKSISIIGVMALCVVMINTTVIADMPEENECTSITETYKDFGFALCFSSSIIDYGIEKPDDYSEEYMNQISDIILSKRVNTEPSIKPNIIFIQLESFFDVNNIKGMTFNENPVSAFSELKNEYSHGFLTVPVIGEGTVNTEFEILTGLPLDIFGACEYPYNTILKESVCDSLCYDLDDYGYSSHVIHNNSGTFYNRNIVFPNLGFDSFTSIEYMNDVSYNPLGWAKDNILLKEMSDTLNSTDESDFVYAISVQPHGKYPTEIPENAPSVIDITSCDYDFSEQQLNAFDYYINQLHETDADIKSITDYFKSFEEPIIIVFYGDHLPHLDLEEYMLKNNNLAQTEYIIWDNFDMSIQNKDLQAYQLNAYIKSLLGMSGGLISTYNTYFTDNEDYPNYLQYLGYDLMYGDKFIYGGEDCNIKPSEMTMGIKKIAVDNAYVSVDADYEDKCIITVNGANFTPFSVLVQNDKALDTSFISPEQLIVYDVRVPEEDDTFSIVQIDKNDDILSCTDNFKLNIPASLRD